MVALNQTSEKTLHSSYKSFNSNKPLYIQPKHYTITTSTLTKNTIYYSQPQHSHINQTQKVSSSNNKFNHIIKPGVTLASTHHLNPKRSHQNKKSSSSSSTNRKLSPFSSEEKFALWIKLKIHSIKQKYITDPYHLLIDNIHLTAAFLSILLLNTITIPSLLTRLTVSSISCV